MDKRFLSVLAAIVIIFIGIFVFTKHDSSTGSSSTTQPTSHIEGKGAKNVTLMEYGDYQCPVCEAYFVTLEQVQAKYGDDISFQFRNLPLTSIHKNAYAAARSAEAAGLQNKYFEMHDLLYQESNWQAWTVSNNPTSFFQNYAHQLNLDLNKFNSDMNSSHVNDLINADQEQFPKDFKAATGSYDAAKNLATPTFFINGKYVDNKDLADENGPSAVKFSTQLDAAIAAKH
jgi:protein-disulfide isomerase